MSVCGQITLGSAVDCTDLNLSGTQATAYFINYEDVDWTSTTKDSGGRVTALVLKSNKYAYAFSGAPTHVKISQDTIQLEGSFRQIKHTVGITIYERTQAQKVNMANLVRGAFICIVHLKGQDDDAIVVAGYDVGLQHVPGTVMDAFANGGNYVFTFATNDGEGEFERDFVASLGADYPGALTIIDGLLEPES
jgi:hypothetical protein